MKVWRDTEKPTKDKIEIQEGYLFPANSAEKKRTISLARRIAWNFSFYSFRQPPCDPSGWKSPCVSIHTNTEIETLTRHASI